MNILDQDNGKNEKRAPIKPRLRKVAIRTILMALVSTCLLVAGIYSYPGNDHYQKSAGPSGDYGVVGPLIKGKEVKFDFTCPVNNLAGVKILWATYARTNSSQVRLELLEGYSGRVIRATTFNAAEIADWSYSIWKFSPIRRARSQWFTIRISSPDATPDTSLALLTDRRPPVWAGIYKVDSREIAGSLPVRFLSLHSPPLTGTYSFWLILLAALAGLYIFRPLLRLAANIK